MSVATLSQELEQFCLNLDDFEPRQSVEAITTTQSQRTPYAEITEQPTSKKFRYPTEPRSAGPIVGVNTTPEQKTYPTIKIHNYIGEVRIIVSCVTKDEPYRPHPHRLLDRAKSKTGLYIVSAKITAECNEYQFKNLGIQCVKRLNVVEALREKQAVDLDPFKTGYEHINNHQNIDLKAVRLCFQVFIPREAPALPVPLTPVVSDILYSDKASVDLTIVRASHCSGSVEGGTQVILLCDKVTKDDTVLFYLEENNEVVWEATANTVLIHKQAAIVIETPAFMDQLTNNHVTVRYQLQRAKDKIRGNSFPFEYIPKYTADHKRKKVEPILQLYNNASSSRNMSLPEQQQIKLEPNETSIPLFADPWSIAENNQVDPVMPGPSSYLFWQNGIAEQSYIQQPSSNPNIHHISQTMKTGKALQKELLHVTANVKPLASFTQLGYPNVQPKTSNVHPPFQPESNLQLLATNMQTLPPDIQLLSSDMHLNCDMQPKSANVQPVVLNMQRSPPILQPMSSKPYTQSVTTNMQPDSPNMHPLFTHTQMMTPDIQSLSLDMQPVFPNMQVPSYKIEAMSPPNIEQMSPSLQHDWGHVTRHMPSPAQQVQQPTYQEVDMDMLSSSSLSKLAQDSSDELMLNSKELAEFCSLLTETNNTNENLLVQF